MPLDLAVDIAAESGVRVDEAGFEQEMAAQRARGRESWHRTDAVVSTTYRDIPASRFVGYGQVQISDARIVALARNGVGVQELREGEEGDVFLDSTPFYPEGGGQVGDRGVLAGPEGVADVLDTTSQPGFPGLIFHKVRVSRGTLGVGQKANAWVDGRARTGAASHHTLTHMLHAALRETLGPHVKQAGSLVAPNRLRFDFSHFAPLTPGEIEQIEGRVTEKILEDIEVETAVLPIDEALKRGAIARAENELDIRARRKNRLLKGLSREKETQVTVMLQFRRRAII
jgi:alanyl-tRNA synthetase